MDPTTVLEVILLSVAATTAAFSFWSLYISHVDHLVLTRLQQNGIKRLTMVARLVRDIARAVCSLVLFFGAAWCVYLPPDRDLAAVVMKVTLLVVSALLGAAVIVDFWWRKQIDEALDILDQNLPETLDRN